MKRFLMTAALTCAVSVPTLAGDIPSDGLTATTPDEPTPTSTTAPGDVPSVGYADETSDAGLNLMQMMVGLIV